MAPTGKTAIIEDALHYWLISMDGSSRIAWPSIIFTPIIGETYLEPSLFFNRTDLAAVGANSPRRHRGFYQVLVKGPKDAPTNQSEVADEIIEHFAGQTIDRNGIRVRIGAFDGGPSVPTRISAPDSDGAWKTTRVTIPWWADTFAT